MSYLVLSRNTVEFFNKRDNYGSGWVDGCRSLEKKRIGKLSQNIPIQVPTRRVPVQRAVERDEIPYPYKVHDTTLRPLLNITIKSTIVRSRSCSSGDICGTTPTFRSDVNIAIVAIRNSFRFNIVKNKEQTQKASGPNVADWQYLGVDKFMR